MIVERPNTLDLCTTDDVGDSSFDVLPADGDASVFCDPPSGPITSPFFVVVYFLCLFCYGLERHPVW